MNKTDYIPLEKAATLTELFQQRIVRSHSATAYQQYNQQSGSWQSLSWDKMGQEIIRWQSALLRENLNAQDKVAIMLPNCPEWIQFDQAALGLNLVTVPLYLNDRPDNVAYILKDAEVKVIIVDDLSLWQEIAKSGKLKHIQRVIVRGGFSGELQNGLIVATEKYLDGDTTQQEIIHRGNTNDLATIVYTSGTTGRPKGVMLSHHNILWNAASSLKTVEIFPDDHLLSFLPLSHTLERSIGYYLAVMSGVQVSFARSVPLLGEDLLSQKPTILIAVPRIFERVYGKIKQGLESKPAFARFLFNQAINIGWKVYQYKQHKCGWQFSFLTWPLLRQLVANKVLAKLGGNIRFAIAGGAPLPLAVGETFTALGLPVIQGYGLTETSPVISVNPLADNVISSVGVPLTDVEVKIGKNDELLTRSPGVTLGYWHNKKATKKLIDKDRWLHTGDKARIEDNHIYITGRLKDIIVLANGEKVPPADMEQAICLNKYIDQAIIIGEGRSYLSAIVVLNDQLWPQLAKSIDLDEDDCMALRTNFAKQKILDIISKQLHDFPGYAKVRTVSLTLEPWTIDNELITPTLKVKRNKVCESFLAEIEELYEGH
jgi:long-chain acyl-CoA synthetase